MCKLQEKVKKFYEANDVESNSMVRGNVDNTRTDGPIPVKPLIILEGTLNGIQVRILKDDERNTNIVSDRLVKKFRNQFKVVRRKVVIQHSKKDSNENASQSGSQWYVEDWKSFLYI